MTSSTVASAATVLAWISSPRHRGTPLFRKVLVGLLAVAIGLAIAGAGYRFGQYLAQKDAASPAVRATS